MNQEIIPDRNLPVYLQKYNVKIFDDKKESVGNVLYTTVGAIPSNEKEKRVWTLNLTGYLKPNVDKYNITYDFSEVDYKYKDKITFQNIISGTFTICGRVLDASKIVGFDYKYNDKESTLTIQLDTSKWDFRLKKEVLFSYNLNVDDSVNYDCGSNVGKIIENTSYDIYLQIGDSNADCYTGHCGTTNSYSIDINSSLYYNFEFDRDYYGFGGIQIAPLDGCGGKNCDKKELQLSYSSGNGCVTVTSGTPQKITDDSEKSLYVKYTYNSTIDPCTQTTCIDSNELSDYYIGTIEFSTIFIECAIPVSLELNTSYNIYVGISNCYMTSCSSSVFEITKTCLIQNSSIFYQYFMINNFPSELNLSTTGIDSSSCSPTESTSNIYLYYGDECALLTTGNPKPISLDANVDGISYLFDLSVTYTYSDTPGVNIWTASGCQGDSISDYYIGTIEFSTTS